MVLKIVTRFLYGLVVVVPLFLFMLIITISNFLAAAIVGGSIITIVYLVGLAVEDELNWRKRWH